MLTRIYQLKCPFRSLVQLVTGAAGHRETAVINQYFGSGPRMSAISVISLLPLGNTNAISSAMAKYRMSTIIHLTMASPRTFEFSSMEYGSKLLEEKPLDLFDLILSLRPLAKVPFTTVHSGLVPLPGTWISETSWRNLTRVLSASI